MSNVEDSPQELLCPSNPAASEDRAEVLEPRLVPLGGPRAMTVRRTLPQRSRSLIGAWCFIDHYGPEDVSAAAGMAVPPHPHTGLQTISWLFTGEIRHADSAGNHAMVLPGQLNLMTAGRGISHSEYSTAATSTLHGVQLWAALPDHARFTDPGFEHFTPTPIQLAGATASVFMGTVAGKSSPVTTFTPMVGAEITIDAETRLTLDLSPSFEHGFLVDSGSLTVAGTPLAATELAYLGTGRAQVELQAGAEPVRLLLIGGEPLNESIVMWWNFVGRSHEEIVSFRAAWQNAIGLEGDTRQEDNPFSLPTDRVDAPLPAPALPTVTLRPRTNPSRG
ncbi:pirin [Arthrobacter alpinus]|uniref:pirin family protein n=1 Tax=Arthrobacter alpinus TaxID=656366 RepID=UPI0005CA1FD7|nr:pirin family protein [Arthrobacter alpinus]ALV44949.1 pirin [Arthrobacter alpinus]